MPKLDKCCSDNVQHVHTTCMFVHSHSHTHAHTHAHTHIHTQKHKINTLSVHWLSIKMVIYLNWIWTPNNQGTTFS